jgi:FMN phosphatase YigB (HAD superfamily)
MRTIVWDIDDTLNALTREWFEREWQPAHPECRIGYAALRRNPPHELLGATRDEYLASLDSFRASRDGRALPPVAEALAWFRALGANCRHVALTARPFASVPCAAAWVFEHFSPWIRAFGFVPSARAGDDAPFYDSDKAEWLRWVRAGDIFVDDNPGNATAAEALGLRAVLVPQPWNDVAGTFADALNRVSQFAGIA